ncbi:unnamed protein product [Adineta steineri]|uniref:Heme haloperoxidase family profile domain-containing protein n=2 Tax=Adineta steineri TaxID=433720 RepID=A0A814W7G9_9BILA|nr:unnamed protein product [Adineta steineri]CAF1198651.1 unnamed protein product [Adineta steineri]CAF3624936.1 unnamed protein product [Adineta steineri]
MASGGIPLYNPTVPVDTTGEYEYRPPGPNDKRGPCPGLNALANNGYIDRSGITNSAQFGVACSIIGIGADACTVLIALAALVGNGPVFSIGEGSPETGLGVGKSGIENGDTSYKSSDCALNPTPDGGCDDYSFNDTAWSTTYNAAQLNDNIYNISTFIPAAKARYDESRANNPDFFFGPMQFIFHYVTPALFDLVFSNGTDSMPTEEIENTWIGITKDENGQRLGIPGGGRIPDNWYPRKIPVNLIDGAKYILGLYLPHPVEFGANVDGTFVPDPFQLGTSPTTKDILCLIYNTICGAATATTLSMIAADLDLIFVSGSIGCTPYPPKA